MDSGGSSTSILEGVQISKLSTSSGKHPLQLQIRNPWCRTQSFPLGRQTQMKSTPQNNHVE